MATITRRDLADLLGVSAGYLRNELRRVEESAPDVIVQQGNGYAPTLYDRDAVVDEWHKVARRGSPGRKSLSERVPPELRPVFQALLVAGNSNDLIEWCHRNGIVAGRSTVFKAIAAAASLPR